MAAPVALDTQVRWEGRGVKADAVAQQMLTLRQTASDDEGFPLARASVMNLIVYVADRRQVERVSSIVHELAVRHPSRAIVIAPGPGPKFSLDAEVQVHLHPLGSHGLVFESAILRPHGADPEGLDTLVIPLLIPHLQSVLWWLGDPDPAAPALRSLASVCDRLIVDTARGKGERLPQLSLLAGINLGDLAWARLEGLRETVADVFDDDGRADLLDGLQRLTIQGQRGTRQPVSNAELLLAGWVCSRLGATIGGVARGVVQVDIGGRSAQVAFTGDPHGGRVGADASPLRSVKLEMESGRRHLVVEARDLRGERVVLISDGAHKARHTGPYRVPTEAEALSQELGRIGRDRVFEDTLQSAARITGALAVSG